MNLLKTQLNRNLFFTAATLALALAVLVSCSTKKNKRINRIYHNTTSRFNGYFNGNETIKEAEMMLSTAHRDNYYKIISVYPVGTLEDSKTILPLSDKAIKKGSVVIAKHSMMIRGKEYCKYIDDSYLLLGKSMFYKRDYYASLEMFAYVAREPVKNNKKDPIQHLANIWLCRAYSELGMYSDARLAIDRSLNDKTLSGRTKGQVYEALTDFFLKQNRFEEALEAVQTAVSNTKQKRKATRLLFIQGQLFQKAGELKKATDSYKKVLKSNPSYEMGFYSQINLARCFDAESKNSTEIRALLARMLADPKNADFSDQIHYVLGEVDQKENKEESAINQYNKSIRVSTNNNNQKGMSYLAIAEIHFKNKAYRPSAAYYDSAVTNLNKDYPDYKKIEIKRNSLAELVQKYNVIERYDSLLRMSNLSEADLEKAVLEIIKQEEEKRKKDLEKQAQAAALAASGGGPGGTGATNALTSGGTGLWYFYNPSAKGFGFSEFRKVWGERKLEDNWRRKNKQSVAPVQEETPDGNQPDQKEPEVVMTREDSIAKAKERLLKDLPKDEAQKQAFSDSVMKAFYDIGLIYKERLKDLMAAAETYEEFLRKYPRSKNEATIFYQLYRIYLLMPDAPKADKYKSLILSKYPNSDYAALILDPEHFKKENLSQDAANRFYEETYRMYRAAQYQEALERCKMAETRYEGNDLSARFALLKALITGKLKDVEAFRMSLQSVVAQYPADTVRVKAEQLLAALDRVQGIEKKDSVIAEPSKPIFRYKADTAHYFVILVEDIRTDLKDLKMALSDFNNEFFSIKGLKVNNRLLGTNYQVIMVEVFENKKEGMGYLSLLLDDDYVMKDMDMQLIEMFIITPDNYRVLMKDANVDEYVEFFRKVYE